MTLPENFAKNIFSPTSKMPSTAITAKSFLESELSHLITLNHSDDLYEIENTLDSIHDTAMKACSMLEPKDRDGYRNWFNTVLNDAFEKHSQSIIYCTDLSPDILLDFYDSCRILSPEEEFDELIEDYNIYVSFHRSELEPIFSCHECGRAEPKVELPPHYRGMYHFSISDGCSICKDVDIEEIRRSGVSSLNYVGTRFKTDPLKSTVPNKTSMSVPSTTFIEEIRSKHPIEQLHLIRKRISEVDAKLTAMLKENDYESICDRRQALCHEIDSFAVSARGFDSNTLLERFLTVEKEAKDVYSKFEAISNAEGLSQLCARERELRNESISIMHSLSMNSDMYDKYIDRKRF